MSNQDPLCIFTSEINTVDDQYVIKVPKREVELGTVDPDDTHRVFLTDSPSKETNGNAEPETEPQVFDSKSYRSTNEGQNKTPPVEVGDVREVTIESIGDEGDGIAKVEEGFVLIVPSGRLNETIKVQVTDIRGTFAIAEKI